MTEEELEYRHVNQGMRNFVLIALSMMLIAGGVIAGILLIDHLAGGADTDWSMPQSPAAAVEGR